VITGVTVSPVTSVIDHRAQSAVGVPAPAAPTDLPSVQAINPTANIPPTRNDSRKADKAAPTTSRDAIIDPQTNSVVFRSLDPNTGAVIEQVPAQALLRQRAYVSAQAVQALIKGKDVSAALFAAAQDVDTTA
jgi:hypothetical protein